MMELARTPRRWVPRRVGSIVGAFGVLALLTMSGCGEPESPPDPGELLTLRTVGLALLEENRLEEAEVEFLRLVELVPDEPLGHANLGLTYLRMGRLPAAEESLRRAVEQQPADADVRLILAEILREADRADEARAVLEGSLQADSTHVKSLYALASLDGDALDAASSARVAALLGRIVGLHPGNVAARVARVEAALRGGDAEVAAIELEAVQQIVPTLPVESEDAFDRALTASRAGRAAEALGPAAVFHNVMRTVPAYQQGLIELRGPGGVLVGFPVVTFSEAFGNSARDVEAVTAALRFTDATDLVGLPVGAAGTSGALAVADYDGDRDRDVLVNGRLWRNDVSGFVDVTDDVGLSGPPAEAGLFGDYDNDGVLDLYLARAGAGVVLRGANGGFTDVTPLLGASVPAGAPLWMDFDQDGDLDLVVASSGGAVLLQNNLDGTFRDVTTRSGVIESSGGIGAAAFGDFDDDDDLELVLGSETGRARLYENRRAGAFVENAEARSFDALGATIVQVGDYNNDGWLDLLTASAGSAGIALHLNDGAGSFQPDLRPTALLAAAGQVTVEDAAFVDFDNDGWLDVLWVGAGPGEQEASDFSETQRRAVSTTSPGSSRVSSPP